MIVDFDQEHMNDVVHRAMASAEQSRLDARARTRASLVTSIEVLLRQLHGQIIQIIDSALDDM
jgi:hypothetical protein